MATPILQFQGQDAQRAALLLLLGFSASIAFGPPTQMDDLMTLAQTARQIREHMTPSGALLVARAALEVLRDGPAVADVAKLAHMLEIGEREMRELEALVQRLTGSSWGDR